MIDLWHANFGPWADAVVSFGLRTHSLLLPLGVLWDTVGDVVEEFDPDDYTFVSGPEDVVYGAADAAQGAADRAADLAADAAAGLAEGATRGLRAVAVAVGILGVGAVAGGVYVATRR